MKFRYLMMSLLAVSALAVGCKEEAEDLGLPQITVAGDGITFDATTKKASLEAGADLSSYKTTVTANRPWTVDVTYGSAEKDWIAATPDHGNASSRPQEVLLTLLPNEGRDRTATVKYNIGYDYKILTIKQKGALGSVEDATLYANNFDKEVATQTFGSGTSWPFLDQFDGWQNETGIGAANVTYDYSGISVRNNSNSNGTYSDYEGSGVNNLFFGSGGYITIGNIDISASNSLRLTFGAEKYLQSGDSTFNPDEFTVTLSGNGTDWSKPIAYSFAGGFKSGRWDLATTDFTVPEDVKTLYIRFAASVASAYRLDDVTLIIGDGGDLVDLTGGSTDPGTGDDEPTDDPIYGNNFDKEAATNTYGSKGDSWPYLDQFDGWQNETGIGAANVTYDYSGMSTRNNSNSNGGFSDYEGSGVNNLFFGKDGYITIGNIDISSSNKLHLTFGAEKYQNNGNSVFNPAEFTVTLSDDGKSWSKPISYGFAKGYPDGRWDLATADFSVAESVKTLYIKFSASVASVYRIDDVSLTAGEGGDLVDLTDGSTDPGTGGDEPTEVKAVTVSEFIAAPESETQVYELTGRISAINNTTYGNFDLVDDSGSVYVYGLTATDLGYGATNDKSFGSLGLGVGDVIKIRGYRGSYYETIEVVNAWLVEKLSSGSTDPGIGSGYSFDFSAQGYENGSEVTSVTFDGVTVTFDKGTNNNTPKYYDSGTSVRVYGGGTITVEAGGKTITGIKFTYGTGDPANEITADSGTFSTDTWTGSATSVTFTIDGTSGHRRIKGIEVTLGEGGGSTDPGTDPTPGETLVITFGLNEIKAVNSSFPANSYGSQAAATESTWVSWTVDGITFKGARICEATSGNYVGSIQMQGNATNVANQGFFGNTTPKKITKIVVETLNDSYSPTFNLYLSSENYMPDSSNAEQTINAANCSDSGVTSGGTKLYTTTAEITGDYTYFALRNDKQGANYVKSITVTFE